MQTKQLSNKNKTQNKTSRKYYARNNKINKYTRKQTNTKLSQCVKRVNNMKGGKLTKDNRKKYITKVHQLYTQSPEEQNNNYKILVDLLQIAYSEARKNINSYIDKLDTKDFTPEEKENKKAQIEQMQDIFDNLDNEIDIMKFGAVYHNLDIPEFNMRSLQLVILFTELERLTNSNPDETSMKGYFQQPGFKIDKYYNELLPVFPNWISLSNKIIQLEPYEKYGRSNRFIALLGYYKQISNKYTFIYHTCKQIKNNIQIIIYLDYLTLQDIIMSYANNVYLLGIAETMTWADGKLLTPFEFLHHDITHALNRDADDLPKQNTIKFMKYLDTIKDTLSEKQIYEIKIILFIIIHESRFEFMLSGPINLSIYKSYSEICFGTTFLCDWKNWKNDKYYGSMLPKNLFKLKDDTIVEDEAEQTEIIKAYLNRIFEFFITIWNQFIESLTKRNNNS